MDWTQETTSDPPGSQADNSSDRQLKGWDEFMARATNAPTLPSGYHFDDAQLDLHKLGCSDLPQTTTYRDVFEARSPEAFNYVPIFLRHFGFWLAISAAISLAVYGIIRAIGWVIGGFAAS
jgi:hypothetical protein